MPDKSFSFYVENKNVAVDTGKLLLVEVARSHIVFMVVSGNNKVVSGFELFTYNENEASDLQQLFNFISLHSLLSGKLYSRTEVFINNEFCVPVPEGKFSKEIAGEYANVVFGENPFSTIQIERISSSTIMNVFRVDDGLFRMCQAQFTNVTFRHTWSNIINAISSKASLFPSEYILVQFYNTFITTALVKDSKLSFIQSFAYENPDDVIYFLLNICSHFGLDFEMVSLHICGMIDPDFNLYRELIKYCKHIVFENAASGNLLIDIKEYPLHYFTPFFNLAL